MSVRWAAFGAAAGAVLAILAPSPAGGKSAFYEIRNRCPCAGPSARTFWASRDERMACVDGVLDELAATWPEEILVRDREREARSRCGDPRYQCDGTPNRPCPGRTVCEAVDAFCDPAGVASVCMPPRQLRRWHGCRYEPPACGCDGKTYATPCQLWRRGATLAHGGRCSEGCAGPEGIACAPGAYCVAPNCGDGGAWGQCVPGPCSDSTFGPVCGCDGVTYAGVCAAAATGVGIRYLGACEDAE